MGEYRSIRRHESAGVGTETGVDFSEFVGSRTGMRSSKLHIRRVCSQAHEFPSTRRRSSFPDRRKGIAMPSDRPFVFCHMLTSLDGKISGDYMSTPEGGIAGEVFDRIAFGTHPYSRRSHRNKEKQATPRSLPPDPHSLAKSGSEQPESVVTPIPGRRVGLRPAKRTRVRARDRKTFRSCRLARFRYRAPGVKERARRKGQQKSRIVASGVRKSPKNVE